MASEGDFRELAGYSGQDVKFMGSAFRIRPDGLAPLIRFARAQPATATQKDGQAAGAAAAHRLLEECIEDFPDFSDLAISAKADGDDISAVVHYLIEFYCARSRWPAIRLIGYIAANLEEVDGKQLCKTGRGLAGLSAREACNLALAMCLDGRDEEDRELFLIDLNYEGNPEAEAQELVMQMIAAKAAARG